MTIQPKFICMRFCIHASQPMMYLLLRAMSIFIFIVQQRSRYMLPYSGEQPLLAYLILRPCLIKRRREKITQPLEFRARRQFMLNCSALTLQSKSSVKKSVYAKMYNNYIKFNSTGHGFRSQYRSPSPYHTTILKSTLPPIYPLLHHNSLTSNLQIMACQHIFMSIF